MPHLDPPRFPESELLPDSFRVADRASLQGQDYTLFWFRCQLGLTLLAALFGTFPEREVHGVNVVPLFAVCAFLGAGAFAWALHRRSPQADWYRGRAAAESVKALAWKYSVRAAPFEGPPASPEADRRFDELLDSALRLFRTGPATVVGSGGGSGGVIGGVIGGGSQITKAMREERASTLRERRNLYVSGRVDAQRVWYLSRADEYENRSNVWALWTASAFVAGAAVAVLEVTAAPSLRALGLLSAGVASATAWTQLLQFRPLASTYRLAAGELERLAAELRNLDVNAPDAEERWSWLAREADDVIMHEHLLWRARSERRI